MVGLSWLAAHRHRSPHSPRLKCDFDQFESRCLMAAGSAPTNLEQYMLELINRTRENPTAEGQRLLSLAETDPLIRQATANWNLSAFYQLISSYAPEPPLAFNPRLIDAARVETSAMLAANAQRHAPAGYLTNPSVAVASDGQAYLPVGTGAWASGENIFAYSQGVDTASSTAYADYFEAGFLLDWGNPDFGHLKNILAPGPSAANLAVGVYPFSEVGIGLVTNVTPTTPAAYNVGPAIVTQEFGWRQGVSFLTGTFSLDTNGDGFYTPGEGYGGVTIRAQGTGGQGTFQTQAWPTGGYSLRLPAGNYNVTASGPLPGVQTTTITIGADNVGWSVAFNPDQAADIPVPADYDGVGRAEVTTYRSTTGVWTINNPFSGVHTVPFGLLGDIPVPGHYDGGTAELAVFRPSTATWYIFGHGGPYARQFGGFGDIPVPGDYDGDGKTDLAVYRPSTGVWYIFRSRTNTLQVTQWGLPYVDQPVPAAYDGEGRTEIAVLRPTTYQWFIVGPSGYRVTQFGAAGMIPVPGDYDGVGRAEVAVYQPTTGEWFIQPTARSVNFGLSVADSPVPADYDGDGTLDIGVFRNPTAEWFEIGSRVGITSSQLGQGGTGSTLRSLGAISLRAPGPWVGWVVSAGGVQAGSPGTSATASTLSRTSVKSSYFPARTISLTPAGKTPRPTHRHHAHRRPPQIEPARNQSADADSGLTHFTRRRSSKKA